MRVDELDLDGVALELALERVRRALGDDPAAVDDGQLRGQPVGLLEVVGGEQDRHPLVAGEALDLVPHVGPRLGVEAGGRLVEEEHAGAVDEAHGQVETALHAARVRLRGPVGGVDEAEALERIADAPAQVGAGDRVELALEREVLAPGRLGVEPVASGRRRRSRGARAPARRARRARPRARCRRRAATAW